MGETGRQKLKRPGKNVPTLKTGPASKASEARRILKKTRVAR